MSNNKYKKSIWCKLCEKYKAIDWIDDNIVYYIWDTPKTWYKTVRCWWYCDATNPWHWKLFFYSFCNNRPWDYCYLYELLYLQINKQYYYFKNRSFFIGDEHKNEILRMQKISISLLEIVLEKRKLWDMVIPGTDDEKIPWDKVEYKCLVNVNTKNAKRFAVRGVDYTNNNKLLKCYEYFYKEPHELYIEKAKHLFHTIMRDYGNNWWD